MTQIARVGLRHEAAGPGWTGFGVADAVEEGIEWPVAEQGMASAPEARRELQVAVRRSSLV